MILAECAAGDLAVTAALVLAVALVGFSRHVCARLDAIEQRLDADAGDEREVDYYPWHEEE